MNAREKRALVAKLRTQPALVKRTVARHSTAAKAAAELGISPRTLFNLLREFQAPASAAASVVARVKKLGAR